MREESLREYLQRLVRQSGMTGRLILINTIFSVFFGVLFLIEKLFLINGLETHVKYYFSAPGDITQLIYRPWAILTQLFTHEGFWHYAFNMLMLYFSARIFVSFFGERRLLTTYLLGGIFAYLFHLAGYAFIPVFAQNAAPPIIGASGSIMAIFIAVCVYRPTYKLNLFGLLPVPLIVIAVLYIFADLNGLGKSGTIAHLAHLGGALFGALSVINVNSPSNFMNRLDRLSSKIKRPKVSFKRKPKFKVYKGGGAKHMTDEEYNFQKQKHQERVDAILEKISKKGYEGLTKEEKEILFNESKRK